MPLPKISIITPSYNQGRYLEETILSVLGQNYPNLEYFIMDGGSTDNSVDIIKKYAGRITHWVSEKDKGQAAAINKGFSISTGEILLWLNSDDLLMPGVLTFIASIAKTGEENIYIGNCIHFKEEDDKRLTSWGSDIINANKTIKLTDIDYIIQPSSFWTRKAWDTTGVLNEHAHFTFDWEWFLRATEKKIPITAVAKGISLYRFHNSHKSSAGGSKRQQEISDIYRAYNPRIAALYKKLLNEDLSVISKYQKTLKNLPLKLSLTISDGFILKKLKPVKYKNFSDKEVNLAITML